MIAFGVIPSNFDAACNVVGLYLLKYSNSSIENDGNV